MSYISHLGPLLVLALAPAVATAAGPARSAKRTPPSPQARKSAEFIDAATLTRLYEQVHAEDAPDSSELPERWLTADRKRLVEVDTTYNGMDTLFEVWVRVVDATTGKELKRFRLNRPLDEGSPMARATYDRALDRKAIVKANKYLAQLSLWPGQSLALDAVKVRLSEDLSEARITIGEHSWTVALPKLSAVERPCCSWGDLASVVGYPGPRCWSASVGTQCRWDSFDRSSACFHEHACGDECLGVGLRTVTSHHCVGSEGFDAVFDEEPLLPGAPVDAK